MAFLDDWSRKIGHMGQSTLQKTKDAAGVARMNSQIYEEEKKINALYLEIGKRYVSLHADDCEAAMADIMQEVKAAFARINECREQIRQIKGVKICEKCGAEVQDGALFCSNCGNRISQPVKDGAGWCANCGAALQPDTLFCTNCGTPVKAMKDQEAQRMDFEESAAEMEEAAAEEAEESPAKAPSEEPVRSRAKTLPEEPEESPAKAPSEEAEESPAEPVGKETAEAPAEASFPRVCPCCKAVVREGVSFCTNCGHRLGL